MSKITQRISPFLWFDTQAEEAVNFYTSIFEDSKIVSIMRCGDAGPGPKGSVLTIAFQLAGQQFVALNGGPHVKFNDGVSFVVNCETQEEVDRYWDLLTAGGQVVECGWLKDKFGLSWQVTPTVLIEMIHDPDTARADRVMKAMMQMKKLEIAPLQRAYQG
ncbi:MAG: VOC family protein [Acidobacteriota bacterium]